MRISDWSSDVCSSDLPDDEHRLAAADLDGPGEEGRTLEGMQCGNAGDVAAEAEEGGVAEAHHAAGAEREVEADAGQRQDRDAGGEPHVKRLVTRRRNKRRPQAQNGRASSRRRRGT